MFYRKLEKYCLYPMMTFFIAIDERVSHWLFWLGFSRSNAILYINTFLLTFTRTNSTMETQIQGVKYAQRQQ